MNIESLQAELLECPQTIQDSVSINFEVMHGHPCIAGTRVPIYLIVEALADGMSIDQILEDYPEITLAKLYGSLAFLRQLVRVF